VTADLAPVVKFRLMVTTHPAARTWYPQLVTVASHSAALKFSMLIVVSPVGG